MDSNGTNTHTVPALHAAYAKDTKNAANLIDLNLKKKKFNKTLILVRSIGENIEKKEPSYAVGGNAYWHSHYGKRY